MLDFRTQTFLSVCRHGSFTKAAQELNLTQPCVSQHIRHLENYYGVKLFTYDGKTLALTHAGETIHNALLSFRHDELRLKDAVRTEGRRERRLKFGATLSVGGYYLPERLVRFLQSDPALQIDLTISDTQNLLTLLDGGSIDFALIEGFFSKAEYDHIPIRREELVAVRGAEYPLGEVRRLSDLFGCPLIVREAGSGTREVLARYLEENGYSLARFSRISTVNDPHLILELLIHNLGIGFLYRPVVERELQSGRLVRIPVPGCAIAHEFSFIWRKNSIFADSYRAVFRRLIGGAADA